MFSRPRAEDRHHLHPRSRAVAAHRARASTTRWSCWRPTRTSGRMRPAIAGMPRPSCRGESFGEALAQASGRLPADLCRAGARSAKPSGTLTHDSRGARARSGARARPCGAGLSTRCAIPPSCCLAAGGVMIFFLTFVLPAVRRRLPRLQRQARSGAASSSSQLSDFLRANASRSPPAALGVASAGWLIARRPARSRARAIGSVSQLPLVRPAIDYHRASLFCRNLSLLLSSGVTLSATPCASSPTSWRRPAVSRSGHRSSTRCATAASCRRR